MTTKPTVFEFDFHGSVQLTTAEIWPDGDAPEKPNVQDVLALLLVKYGGETPRPWVTKDRWLSEWNMFGDVGVTITGPGGRVDL